jgi:hypothetical protein
MVNGSPQSRERSKFGFGSKSSGILLILPRVYVTFVDKDGDENKIAVNKGDNLLTIAQANDIEMEGKLLNTPRSFGDANTAYRSM